MSEPERKPVLPGTFQFIAEPVIIGHEVGTPDVEPLFANHFEVMVSNGDVFIDIGIIDPRAIATIVQAVEERPSEIPTVKFSVLQRLAISPATLAMLGNKINDVLSQMRTQMKEIRDDASKGQDTAKQSR